LLLFEKYPFVFILDGGTKFILMILILIVWHVHKIVKSEISFGMSVRPSVRLSVCLSVCLHGTTWLPVSRFFWKLIFEYFFKINQENSSLIKVTQE
jgi:hypothetical protein